MEDESPDLILRRKTMEGREYLTIRIVGLGEFSMEIERVPELIAALRELVPTGTTG